jgi:hypothetical protein
MNCQDKMAMISERREKTAVEAKKLAKEAGLNKQDTKDYLFDADSNAIWDAEANMPYQSPKPPDLSKVITVQPMYSTEEFCNKYLSNK